MKLAKAFMFCRTMAISPPMEPDWSMAQMMSTGRECTPKVKVSQVPLPGQGSSLPSQS